MGVTYNQILRDMRDFQTSKGVGRNPNHYPDIKILELDVKPMVGMKYITFNAVVEGSSSPYNTKVRFLQTRFSEERKEGWFPIDVKGNLFYYEPPNLRSNNVQLYCNCSDMRHTFSHQLFKNKAWIGKPRSYTKAPGSNRPPRNPKDAMGVCKHVHNLVKLLQSSDYIL